MKHKCHSKTKDIIDIQSEVIFIDDSYFFVASNIAELFSVVHISMQSAIREKVNEM